MITAYYLAMGVESETGWFPVVSHIAGSMFGTFTIWGSIIFVCMVTSAVELGNRSWNKLITEDGTAKDGYTKQIDESEALKEMK